MKSIKRMIMGTAAVMSVLTIGTMSVSAQVAMPQKADRVETQKAAQSVTIDLNTESNAYSISSAGNAEVNEDVCVLISDEAENIDITQLKVNVKQDRENNKFLISWDNGETWHEMDMPVVADALK